MGERAEMGGGEGRRLFVLEVEILKSVRLSGKGSIDCAAVFKVGSCECLSFVSICCLVGGWLLGGICRAGPIALLGGRKGELEGGRGDIYVYVYTTGKNERNGRIERDVRVGNVSQQQHQLKQLPSTHQNIHIYPSRYTQQSGQTPYSRVNRCIHQNLSTHPHQTPFLLSKQSHCPASTSLQLKHD